MLKDAFFVSLGGFFGALFRFIVLSLNNKFFHFGDYFGVIFVNILGSFLLGTCVGYFISPSSFVFYAIQFGFLGSLTTFSSITLHSMVLYESANFSLLFAYLLTSFLGGFFAFFLGRVVGSLL